ncbi:MAG: glycosyltransferase family 2 protein, partial [Phormidium sp.]
GSYLSFNGNVYANLLLTNFLDSGSNVLIRTDALKKVGYFEESRHFSEDWDLWLRLAANYNFVAVSKPQILYRISSYSKSTNIGQMESDTIEVIDRAFARNPTYSKALKQLSKGNVYKYMLFRCLNAAPKRHDCLIVVKFLLQSVKYDHSLIRKKVILKVLLRIITLLVLPREIAVTIINKYKRLYNIDALLIYMKKGIPFELK